MASIITKTDWQTITYKRAVANRRAYVELPTFTVPCVYESASRVVCQFNFAASSNFVITVLPTKPVGANYVPCIKYRVGDIVYRYKLWDDDSVDIQDAPQYVNQVIKKNFVIEVWNLDGQTEVSNAVARRFITGVRAIPPDWKTTSDYELAAGTQHIPSNVALRTIPISNIVTFDWNSPSPRYQPSPDSWSQAFPPGTYRIYYLGGAYADETPSTPYYCNAASNTHAQAWSLTGENVGRICALPGDHLTKYATIEACEAANYGAYTEFTLDDSTSDQLINYQDGTLLVPLEATSDKYPSYRIEPVIGLPLTFDPLDAWLDNPA